MSINYGISKEKGFVSDRPLTLNPDNQMFPDNFKPLYVVEIPEKLELDMIEPIITGKKTLKVRSEEETEKIRNKEPDLLSLLFEDISIFLYEFLTLGTSIFKENKEPEKIEDYNKKIKYMGIVLVIIGIFLLLGNTYI